MITNSSDNERCNTIAENLKRIRENIADAAVKAGRSENSVRLMAVTKTVDAEFINYSIDNCGVDLIGENKVQEFLGKRDLLHLNGVEKHLIGHLQTNKVRKIIGEVDMIQSVDSFHLAEEIALQAAKCGITAKVLLELNLDAEVTKTGFDSSGFFDSLEKISELKNIEVCGLMTVPPVELTGVELERYFDKIHSVYSDVKSKNLNGFNMQMLSMGMSGDYQIAVKHGSDLVRVGSAIYGARIYNK